jgi:xanthine dehydrogenase iron-sulfur cluster and FAD-binding subunit A
MIMAALALGSRPTLADMRTGLAGNLCRCTGYSAIYRSISSVGGRGKTGRLRRGQRVARVPKITRSATVKDTHERYGAKGVTRGGAAPRIKK